MKEPAILRERLIEARTKKGLSGGGLAALINERMETEYSASTVGNWESRASNPSFPVLIVISKILGVSTDYLLGNESKPEFESLGKIKETTKKYNQLEPEQKGEDYGSEDIEKLNKRIKELEEENKSLQDEIKGMLKLGKSMGLGSQVEEPKQTEKLSH